MYQIRMYHTCRCTINGTAVSLFVYSLVGGGTHDTYVPPKKQLYRCVYSLVGGGTHGTNVPPVDAHV